MLSRLFWAMVISGVLMIIYFGTASRFITGFADSDELIGVSFLGGNLHPPGYPLFRLIVYVVTNIGSDSGLIHRAHLISSVFQALAAGVLFLNIGIVLDIYFDKTSRLVKTVIAGLMSLLLGVSFSWIVYRK